MRLQKIIQQLDENNYSMLVGQLKESKGDKFMLLLSGYRNKLLKEQDLLKKLDITPSAFYALRSRLEDKVHELLYKNTNETRIKLLQNVANIEQLVYKTPRETSIGLLKKLEKELLQLDMTNELVIVYRALKKLHLHSAKYYDYSALYNRYVAFNLGQDKAVDLLCSFCKTLGEYYLNRNDQLLDILVLYKKEMENVCKLYESHHLHVYKNILNIHFALFSPVKKEMENDETIENMLKETLAIIEAHEEDRSYGYLLPILDFLYFEYYHRLKLYKDARDYYVKITENIQDLMLCSHSAHVFHFFISKIEYAIVHQQLNELYLESNLLNYEVNVEDKAGYALFNYYLAAVAFYSNNYSEVVRILTKLSNEINFIDNPFIGVDIKLFLALTHILNESPMQADILVRSASRKIAEIDDAVKYSSHLLFISLLKVALSPKTNDRYKKIIVLNQRFKASNRGTYRVLEFLKLNGATLKQLAMCESSRHPKKALKKANYNQ